MRGFKVVSDGNAQGRTLSRITYIGSQRERKLGIWRSIAYDVCGFRLQFGEVLLNGIGRRGLQIGYMGPRVFEGNRRDEEPQG